MSAKESGKLGNRKTSGGRGARAGASGKKKSNKQKTITVSIGGDSSGSMGGLGIKPMNKTATTMRKERARELWAAIDSIKTSKLDKRQWRFVLHELEKKGQSTGLDDNEGQFLFKYIDKDGDGELDKVEFEQLVHLVLSKYPKIQSPKEIFRKAYEYAENDLKRMGGIDYKIQKTLIRAENTLQQTIENMEYATQCYERVTNAIKDMPEDGSAKVPELFKSPKKGLEDALKPYEATIALGDEQLQQQHKDVKNKLLEAEEATRKVNEHVKVFLEQGARIKYLEARDAKGCKMCGCLCC